MVTILAKLQTCTLISVFSFTSGQLLFFIHLKKINKNFHRNDDKIKLNEATLNIPLNNTLDYHQDYIIIRYTLEDEKTKSTINDEKGNEIIK